MPVEILDLLAPRPGEIAVDLTAGRGGHSVLLAEAVGAVGAPGEEATGHVILVDRDPANLAVARARVEGTGTPCDAINDTFAVIGSTLDAQNRRADVVLADLGFSSTQMDDPERGFSFSAGGPLDMRYDRRHHATAADLIATMGEEELAGIIHEYGEEPLARKIARKVVQTRRDKPIETTAELAELVVDAYGSRARTARMHPATRTFMALRIAVNEELDALDMLLGSITTAAKQRTWLNPGARVAIMSFHSLEDRLVKHAFADMERQGLAKRITRKPVVADADEVYANPRSRSAKLRVVRIDD